MGPLCEKQSSESCSISCFVTGPIHRTSPGFVISNAIRKGDDRISTFDDIVLGPPYNIISSAVLSHEIVHIQQQGVECVERDFIHDEFLPIFIEKVCMDELDPSKQILRLYERHRFSILMNQYCECLFEKDEANILDYLKYIKSTLAFSFTY